MVVVRAENIDPANDDSQYAWGENVGWINAEPQGEGGPGAQVGDFELTGWMWGENIGWISLSCANTGSCGSNAYGVTNDSFGVLGGYAWSENAGWIRFAHPSGGVVIDPATGDFSGFAWGENIGWISFNCVDTTSCPSSAFKVRTSWTCGAAAPAGSPGLALGRSGSDAVLAWSLPAGAGRVDVVHGTLSVLRSSGGDFAVATLGCLADDEPGTGLTHVGPPATGDGYWYLVRGVSCGGGGTYDTGSVRQVGSRDAEIAASSSPCP
jgi:hypothetical protein